MTEKQEGARCNLVARTYKNVRGLRVFRCLVLQAARAVIFFVFELGDVFCRIGKTLQAGFEYG